jgi:hypothetical protein
MGIKTAGIHKILAYTDFRLLVAGNTVVLLPLYVV